MLAILEGTDGAGKSTLADAVEREVLRRRPDEKIVHVHSSQLKQDALLEYATPYEHYRPGSGTTYICDRLHIGETIYGPLYREKSALSVADLRWTELYLKARGASLWHVTAPLSVIEHRLQTRGEDYLLPEHVEHVWSAFKDACEESLLYSGTADTAAYTADELAVRVVNAMEYEEGAVSELLDDGRYVGRALPRVLLVGDAQGGSNPSDTRAAFYPKWPSCGIFLLEGLPEKWWHTVGMVNAREADWDKLLECLYMPQVVALGSVADTVLTKLGVEHSTVPHPQRIRRFHNKLKTDYGRLIRQAAEEQGDWRKWPN